MPGPENRSAADDYPPISDYAIIGDCRSAALISKAGSIDWLCLPTFQGRSFFAAILDAERGGRFAIRPTGRFDSTRRYIDDSNVLETTFTTDSGKARLVDCMPVASEADKRRELWPEHEILRRVECLEGEVEIEVVCDPRPDFGRVVPRLADRGHLGFVYENAAEALVLRSEIDLALEEDGAGTRGRVTLAAGDVRCLGMSYTDEDPAILPAFGDEIERKIAGSVRWWQRWADRCRYEGDYREAVVRSTLAVKLLTFAPSGAVIAAATTSLPEVVGGVRNWDYRFCWLRDSSMTLEALMDLGYDEEAHAFLSWMLHSTRRSWPDLNVMYDIYGRTGPLAERELEHLEGYRGSRPVRVGNGAADQLQLDVYGEVASAVVEYVRRGGELDRWTSRLLSGLGETVCRCWREPDDGIWESRGERQHHTYSKVMCWVALDRLLELADKGHIDVSRDKFEAERDEIRDAVERRSWNEDLGSYVRVFDGDDLDASLLLLDRVGFLEPGSARMRGTLERIQERLAADGGPLLYRYLAADGLPGDEGAFGIAGFWWAACRCRQGDLAGAIEAFEEQLELANDVGLYAEEFEPRSKAFLGNFPQAFTHVGLIDAALTIAEATRGEALRGEEASRESHVRAPDDQAEVGEA